MIKKRPDYFPVFFLFFLIPHIAIIIPVISGNKKTIVSVTHHVVNAAIMFYLLSVDK